MTINYDQHDEAELLKVARLVIRFNAHARGYKPAEIVERMKSAARELEADANGYIATGGWMVSAYRADDGSCGIKPSLAAHCFGDDV